MPLALGRPLPEKRDKVVSLRRSEPAQTPASACGDAIGRAGPEPGAEPFRIEQERTAGEGRTKVGIEASRAVDGSSRHPKTVGELSALLKRISGALLWVAINEPRRERPR